MMSWMTRLTRQAGVRTEIFFPHGYIGAAINLFQDRLATHTTIMAICR
jgi:hypothetical protein